MNSFDDGTDKLNPRRIEVNFLVKVSVERDTDEPRSPDRMQELARLAVESAVMGIHRDFYDDLKYRVLGVKITGEDENSPPQG